MKLVFPEGTDPAAAEALRRCHAAFPSFPLPSETVALYLAELSEPGAAEAATALSRELAFFPSIAEVRNRAGAPAASGPSYLRPAEPLGPRWEPPPLGWGAAVADWIKRGAKGPPPAILRLE